MAANIEITDLKELQKTLSYSFKDEIILAQALTHKSYAHEKKGIIKDNERLEFLGDAVLDLSISHLIMERFPDLSEGDMSKLRASVVNEGSLAVIAEEFGLNKYLLLGHGEELSGEGVNLQSLPIHLRQSLLQYTLTEDLMQHLRLYPGIS